MKAEIEGQNLLITIPLEKPTPSHTGRTLLVCSSRGVQPVDVKVNGKTLYLVVNGFIYPDKPVSVARRPKSSIGTR